MAEDFSEALTAGQAGLARRHGAQADGRRRAARIQDGEALVLGGEVAARDAPLHHFAGIGFELAGADQGLERRIGGGQHRWLVRNCCVRSPARAALGAW